MRNDLDIEREPFDLDLNLEELEKEERRAIQAESKAPDLMSLRSGFSDMTNALALKNLHGDSMRFDHESRSWHLWDLKRWAVDRKGEADMKAKNTILNFYKEASEVIDDKERQAIIKWALASESERRLRAMLNLAKSELSILAEDLDKDLYLFNVQNGTLDLRDGEALLREHRKQDFITKLAPVEYRPEAEAPRWELFMREVFEDKQELIDYVQRLLGYSMLGGNPERVFIFLYGLGRNGKSTLLSVVDEILGDYARHAEVETFMTKRPGTIRGDIIRLRGARFVTSTETSENQKLAENIVKQLVGGTDHFTGRALYQNEIEFIPQFTPFIATNKKPQISSDPAVWDRIKLIPFKYQVPPEKIDLQLMEKLLAEKNGIFSWIVQGCLDYQLNSLSEPSEVTEATQEYKEESNTLADFLSENFIKNEQAFVKLKEIHRQYQRWAEENNERPMSNKALSRRLEEEGFSKERMAEGMIIRGLGLMDYVHNEDDS